MSGERNIPVDNKTLDWPRRVANAINYLLGRDTAIKAKLAELEARIEALEP